MPANAASLLVADEIQTGFCRTGDWFACEHEGVVPDLVATAKGIAGGMPLAAVTGRAEIMDAVHVGGLGGTYGGNPVACAAALAAIEIMRRPRPGGGRPPHRAGHRPTAAPHCRAGTRPIGDVRGRGAMMAMELVRPGTTEPDRRRRPPDHRSVPSGRGGDPVVRELRQRHPPVAAAGHRRRLLAEGLDVLAASVDEVLGPGR